MRNSAIFFLESEIEIVPPEQAFFQVVPVPYEATVSYGKGASKGPQAILEASQQIESWDGFSIPADAGIYTWPEVRCRADSKQVLKNIEIATDKALNYGLPVILGGEHSITTGVLRSLKKKYGQFGVVQFDAHADLRDSYEGSKNSHACVMHRALDMELPILQLGIRSLSPFEVKLRQDKNIAFIDAWELHTSGLPKDVLPPDFPQNIYITFDVDGLDPAVIPGTGTPEPGGLSWMQAMLLLNQIISGRNIIGFDVVELSPISGQHVSQFAAARLTYNIMGMIQRNQLT